MNGILVLDKPQGMTSHDVVSRLRKITGEKSIGHLGTLDPSATGVLPMLLGNYTRLARFFGKDAKAYRGAIRFGFATDTYDAEGSATSDPAPELPLPEQVLRAALRFQGELEQTPPPYSAKKVGGTPAYKLARAGRTVQISPARITIHRFTIVGYSNGLAEFHMEVSSGGYVRSVAHDLGQALGCGAHLANLRRTKAGGFSLQQATTLEGLAELASRSLLEGALISVREVLLDMPAVTVDEETAGRIRNGMNINLPEFSQAPEVKIFSDQRTLLGIGHRVAGTLFQPIVVLG